MAKLGFIGVGNMGEAIFRGVLKKGLLPTEEVYIYDSNVQKIKALQQEFGVLTAQSGSAMASACDIIVLAVKPNVCASVLKECGEALADKALISIVTGWSKNDLLEVVPKARILRVMPNTPCLVGEGMIVLDMDHNLSVGELTFAHELFSSVGRVLRMPSLQMPAVTGVSGSGPAYVYLFIEALADGGVRAGLSRDLAYELAAQTVIGAGKMVLQTGMHPAALKDAVCSPSGTTIEAIAMLEHAGFRSAILSAVDACTGKAKEMERHEA